jgi:spermidine/putrescine transport system substrate-binding protein
MKKFAQQFLLFLSSALVLIFAFNSAYADEITVYIWEDYISEQVIESFTKETGIKVKQVYFDSDQTRDEVFASTRGENFDLVVFDAVSAMIFGKNDLLLGITESMVPTIKNIDKRWEESCGNFGVPYFYGTVGLLYDTTKYTSPPDSWADLLTPSKEHQGHVGMLKDMTDTLVPPLIYLGYNLNSEKEDELKKAYELLLQQMPFTSSYDYALTAIQAKGEKKDLHLSLGFSGDQYTLNDATGTENWSYAIPSEGTALWIDCMGIPRKSLNQKNALAFLNYLSIPKVAAVNTEDIYSASPISAVRKLLPEEAANDTDLFPTEEQLSKTQMYRILSDSNLQLRRRILDTLIKQHEAQ